VQNTFEYYTDPFVMSYTPKQGPSIGNTPIKIFGQGFMPLKDDQGNPDKDRNRLWVRFVDPSSGEELAPAKEVYADELTEDSAVWRTPALPAGTKALMQLSPNDQDWIDVV